MAAAAAGESSGASAAVGEPMGERGDAPPRSSAAARAASRAEASLSGRAPGARGVGRNTPTPVFLPPSQKPS